MYQASFLPKKIESHQHPYTEVVCYSHTTTILLVTCDTIPIHWKQSQLVQILIYIMLIVKNVLGLGLSHHIPWYVCRVFSRSLPAIVECRRLGRRRRAVVVNDFQLYTDTKCVTKWLDGWTRGAMQPICCMRTCDSGSVERWHAPLDWIEVRE